jgi:biopolymer transport protein ExbD
MKSFAELDASSSARAEINLSPLIDMVFLLLIFFMVTSVFVEETGVSVQKPEAASAEDLDKNSILIAVTLDGKVVYGGQEIGVNGVRGLVTHLFQDRELPVIVLADEGARTGTVVDVIDECKLAGAKQISIAANRE